MATFMQTDNVYFPANAVALNKNQLLTDKVTMYSGGNDTDGYWIKLSNGIGAYFKKISVTFTSAYNSSANTFYRWVCDDSTNTTIRDQLDPVGIKFMGAPAVWMYTSDAWTTTGHTEATSTNISGIDASRGSATPGYKLKSFTINCNDSTLADITIMCFMLGTWTNSTATDSSHTFIKPQTTGGDDVKWTSNSVAFNNASTPTTLKDMILKNTIAEFTGTINNGGVKFSDGLKICWINGTGSGTLTSTAGAKGYYKNWTYGTAFAYTFSFPPAVFVSSRTQAHIPMSVYDATTTKIGKIVLGGANSTGGCTANFLAIGI